MDITLAPSPTPEPPRSDAELRTWALELTKAPASTPEDYRLRFILNDLLTTWDAERLLAGIGGAL